MSKFIPRGYLTLEKALEYFGQLNHVDECEAEKASSKREFEQLLFATGLSAEVLTDDGILHLLRSNIWGSVGAARIFETGRASISVGEYYFPETEHGVVLIKQSSIDALSDGDAASDDFGQPSSNRSKTACSGWLLQLMQGGSAPAKNKDEYKTEALGRWKELSERSFNAAWSAAIAETGNEKWSTPGRKTKS